MISGSSLFGIDVSKGIVKEADEKRQPVHSKTEASKEVRLSVIEEELDEEAERNADRILPEKVNNVRHDLLRETEQIVDDESYTAEQERNV